MGLFHSSNTKIRPVSCNTDTSTTECGYLRCAQISGIVSLIFSVVTVRGYYLFTVGFKSYSVPGFRWLIVAVFGTIAAIFNLICVVSFHYYKVTYLTQNDDLNIEYETVEEISASDFQWSYWFMVLVTIVLLIVSFSNAALNSDFVLRFLRITPHAKADEHEDTAALI